MMKREGGGHEAPKKVGEMKELAGKDDNLREVRV